MVFSMDRSAAAASSGAPSFHAFVHGAFLPATGAMRTRPADSTSAPNNVMRRMEDREREKRTSTHFAPRMWHPPSGASGGSKYSARVLVTPRGDPRGRMATPGGDGMSAAARKVLEQSKSPAGLELARARQHAYSEARRAWLEGTASRGHPTPHQRIYAMRGSESSGSINGSQNEQARTQGRFHGMAPRYAPPNSNHPWLGTLQHSKSDATVAAKTSVPAPNVNAGSNRSGDGTQRGPDGVFHIKHHFVEGTIPHARFSRGIPPGYAGSVPMHVGHHSPQAAFKVLGQAEPSPRPLATPRATSGGLGSLTPRFMSSNTPRGSRPAGETVVRI